MKITSTDCKTHNGHSCDVFSCKHNSNATCYYDVDDEDDEIKD